MPSRLLVIGGDAAGMSAASTAKRLAGDALEVVVLERGRYTSYSACGIPYWIAGDIGAADDLVARTPEQHRENGIDVRMGVEATRIDLAARTVTTDGGDELEYDHLLIATGAEPVRPDLPGIEAAGILGVQSLDDGRRVLDALEEEPRQVVVVGSGYIGLELAEALVRHGRGVTVIERGPEVMPLLAPELGAKVRDAMTGLGITVVTDAEVTGFDVDAAGHVSGVSTEDEAYPAELVVLGLGVDARSDLAADAGIETGPKGAIVVDERQRVPGHEGVWAAGDCVASTHRLTGDPVHLALGTHANKQGLVAGRAIAAAVAGTPAGVPFPGVVGTAITKICDVEIAVAGLSDRAAADAGFDPVVSTIESTTTAGYYPEASPMTVRIVVDRATRRLLGGQVVGGPGAAWRVDTLAMALWSELTVDDLAMTDLAYAPPFSSVWDPVQVAARASAKELGVLG